MAVQSLADVSVITVLLAVSNSDYAVTIQSPCSHCVTVKLAQSIRHLLSVQEVTSLSPVLILSLNAPLICNNVTNKMFPSVVEDEII